MMPDTAVQVLNKEWASISKPGKYSIHSDRNRSGEIETYLYIPTLDVEIKMNTLTHLYEYLEVLDRNED